jgi:hypothetical protein
VYVFFSSLEVVMVRLCLEFMHSKGALLFKLVCVKLQRRKTNLELLKVSTLETLFIFLCCICCFFVFLGVTRVKVMSVRFFMCLCMDDGCQMIKTIKSVSFCHIFVSYCLVFFFFWFVSYISFYIFWCFVVFFGKF